MGILLICVSAVRRMSVILCLFLLMHGGGYVLGSARQGDAFTLRAASELDVCGVGRISAGTRNALSRPR